MSKSTSPSIFNRLLPKAMLVVMAAALTPQEVLADVYAAETPTSRLNGLQPNRLIYYYDQGAPDFYTAAGSGGYPTRYAETVAQMNLMRQFMAVQSGGQFDFKMTYQQVEITSGLTYGANASTFPAAGSNNSLPILEDNAPDLNAAYYDYQYHFSIIGDARNSIIYPTEIEAGAAGMGGGDNFWSLDLNAAVTYHEFGHSLGSNHNGAIYQDTATPGYTYDFATKTYTAAPTTIGTNPWYQQIVSLPIGTSLNEGGNIFNRMAGGNPGTFDPNTKGNFGWLTAKHFKDISSIAGAAGTTTTMKLYDASDLRLATKGTGADIRYGVLQGYQDVPYQASMVRLGEVFDTTTGKWKLAKQRLDFYYQSANSHYGEGYPAGEGPPLPQANGIVVELDGRYIGTLQAGQTIDERTISQLIANTLSTDYLSLAHDDPRDPRTFRRTHYELTFLNADNTDAAGVFANFQIKTLTDTNLTLDGAQWDPGATGSASQDGTGVWTTGAGSWRNLSTGTAGFNTTGRVWVAGGDAIFGAKAGTAGVVALGGDVSARSLTFAPVAAGSYTITGGAGNSTLTLGGFGVVAAESATLASKVAFSTNQYWTVDLGKTLTLTGAVTSNGNILTKMGRGTLALAGANTWSKEVNVAEGVVLQTANQTFTDRLSLDGGAIYQVTGGTLALSGNGISAAFVRNFGDSIGINNPQFRGNGLLRLSSTTGSAAAPELQFNSGVTIQANTLLDAGTHFITLNNTSGTITGDISGAGGITLYSDSATANNRRLVLGGRSLSDLSVNTFTGDIEIQRGSLHVVGATSLQGNNVLRFNVAAGDNGGFYLEGFDRSVRDLNSTGTGSSVIANSSGANGYAGTTPAKLIVTQNNNGTYTGSLVDTNNDRGSTGAAGALGLVKKGTGTLTLTGSNTYTGGTEIQAGILRAKSGDNLGTGTVRLTGGTLSIDQGQGLTRTAFSGAALDTSAVSGGKFTSDLSALNNNNTAGNVVPASTTYAYTGKIFLTAGQWSFGENYETSARLLINGTQIFSDTNWGTAAKGAITINADGWYDIDLRVYRSTGNFGPYSGLTGWVNKGVGIKTGGVSANGSDYTVFAPGALGIKIKDRMDIANAIAVDSDSTLEILDTESVGDVHLTGAISGVGALTKTGVGMVTLHGANTHTGATRISGGIIAAGAVNVLGSASAYTLDNTAGVALNLNGFDQTIGSLAGGGSTGGNIALGGATLTVGTDNTNTSYAGLVTGTGGLRKVGTGILRLDFANAGTVSNILASTTALTLGGGTVEWRGKSATADVQILNGVTLLANTRSTLRLTQNGATTLDLRLGNLTVGSGATIDFAGASGSTTTGGRFSLTGMSGVPVVNLATAGKRLGDFATWNGTDWAATSGVSDSNGGYYLQAFTGYADVWNGTTPGPVAITSDAAADVRIREASAGYTNNTLAAGTTTINSLLMSAGAHTATVDMTGKTLVVGGVAVGSGAKSLTLGTAANAGVLTSGTAQLTLISNNASAADGLVVNAKISNGGAGTTGLTVSGGTSGGTVVLAGDNDFTGGVSVVSGAKLQVGTGGANGALGTGAVSLDAGTTLTFNRSDAALVAANAISGDGALIQAGTGTTTLTGANTYTGTTTITAGTLRVGAGGVSGSLGSGAVVDNGTLVFDRSDSVVVSNVISGTGVLTQGGSGTTTLTGANTYAGGTVISAGTLQIGNGGTTGSFGSGAVSGTGTLAFNRSDSIVVTNDLGGGISLAQNAASTLVLTGNNTYSGTTTISAGTLQVGNGGTAGTLGTGAVTNNGTLAFNRSDALTVSAAIGGTGSLRKDGAGTTTLTGANTYDGDTLVNDGTLQVGDGGATGTLGDGTVTLYGTLVFNRSNSLTVANTIAGTGSITQAGTGTTIITSDNDAYVGSVTIAAGTLQFGNGGTTGSMKSASIVNNGTLAYNHSDTVTAIGVISGTGNLTQMGTGTLILAGNNTYGGITTINAGSTLQVGTGGNAGNLGVGDTIDNGTLIFNRSNTVTVTSAITGTGVVIQNGTGATTLSGLNTYAGTTTINAGAINLLAGATLGTGAVIVNSGGAFRFGTGGADSVSFAVANDFTLNGGTIGFNPWFSTATISGVLATGTTGGTLSTGRNDNLVLNGLVTGSGPLAIVTQSSTSNASGTVVFNNAANTYNGVVTVSTVETAGVTIGASTALRFATLNFAPATANTNQLAFASGLTSATIGGLTGNAFGGIKLQTGTTAVALTVNNAAANAFAGVISGTGSLTKTGSGSMTLSGQNTYTGGTSVAGGLLHLDFSAPGAASTNLLASTGTVYLDGGTLRITGTAGQNGVVQTFAGLVGRSGASTFDLVRNGATTLDVNIGALSFASGTVNFTGLTGTTAGARVITTASAGANNGATQLSAASALWNGTGWASIQNVSGTNYVVQWTGAYTDIFTGGTVPAVTVPNTAAANIRILEGGSTGAPNRLAASTSTITSLFMTAATTASVIRMNAVSANDTLVVGSGANATGNIAVGLTARGLTIGETAGQGFLTSGSSGASTLNIASANAASTVLINSVIKDNGGAGGVVSLVSGDNVTLAASNTYTGTTTVTGGATLRVGAGGTSGTLGTGSVNTLGTVMFNRSDDLSVGNLITGTGSVAKNGAGVLTLTNSGNTYSGQTVINAGTVHVTGAGQLGTSVIQNNATLLVDGGTYTLTNLFAGTGAYNLTPGAGNTLTIGGSGVATNTGLTTVSSGTVRLQHSGGNAIGGDVLVTGGTLTYNSHNQIADTANVTFSGTGKFSGQWDEVVSSLSLSGTGAGFLYFGTSSTYRTTGAFSVMNNLGSANTFAVDNAKVRAGSFSLDNAFFGITGNGTSVFTLDGDLTGANTASILVGATAGTHRLALFGTGSHNHNFNITSGVTTVQADIVKTDGTSNATLTKTGNGTLILSGANGYDATIVTAGIVRVGEGGSTGTLGAGTVSLASGTTLEINRNNAYTLANSISGAGALVHLGTGVTSLTAASSYTGATTVKSGTLALDFSGATTANIVSSASALVLTGGELKVIGGSGETNTQAFASTLVSTGDSKLTLAQNGATGVTVNLGLITNTLGATVFFNGGTGATPGAQFLASNGTGKLGNWALYSGTDGTGFASVDASGRVVLFSAYTDVNVKGGLLANNATADYRIIEAGASGTVTLAGGGATFSSLQNTANTTAALVSLGGARMTTGGSGTNATGLIQVATGATSLTIGASANDGSVTAGGSGAALLSLISNNASPAAGLTFNSAIVDSGAASPLSVIVSGGTGGGTTVFNGTNTYTGATGVGVSATLQIAGAGTLGAGNYAGAITNAGALVYSSSADQTLSGAISGAGTLTKDTAASTLTLTGALSYTGNTVINAGTLNLGGAMALAAGSFTGNIVDNATLAYGSSGNSVLSGVISGTGVLNVTGTGSLELTGTNTLSGAVNVTGGTLKISNYSGSGLDVVNVGPGGTLVVNATTVNGDQKRVNISGAGVGAATGLTLQGSVVMDVDNGGLNLSAGPTTIRHAGAGRARITGWDTGSSDIIVASAASGSVIDQAIDIGGLTNFSNTYGTAISVTAGANTATGDLRIDGKIVQSTNSDDNIIVRGTGSVNFTGQSDAYVARKLSVENTATMMFTGAASLGGGTNASLISVNTGAKFIWGSSADQALKGVISGGGSVTKSGTGTLTLGAANTYTGGTSVAGGVLSLDFSAAGAPAANLLASTGVVYLDGGTMRITGTAGQNGVVQTFSGLVARSGASTFQLVQNGATTLDVNVGAISFASGTVNFTGLTGTTAGARVITSTSAGANDSQTQLSATSASWNGTGFASVQNFGGVNYLVQWTGSFSDVYTNIAGGPTAIPNLSTASVRILDGGVNSPHNTLAVSSTTINSLLMAATVDTSTVDMAAADTLTILGAGNVMVASTARSLTLGQTAGNGTLTAGTTGASTLNLANLNSASLLTVNAVIRNNAGSGAVSVVTSGKVTLAADNLYTGTTTVGTGSVLQIGAGGITGTTGTGAITDNGSLVFNRGGAASPLTVANIISGSGSVTQQGAGTVILSGTNTYTGATIIASGSTLQVGAAGTTGTLGSGAIQDDGTLTFNRSNSITVNNVISGAGSVVQNGAGTLVLGGANTYSGGTVVNTGRLHVRNSDAALGTGTLTIAGNATLATDSGGGARNLANAVTINSGVTLTVDAGFANLTLSGVVSGAGNLSRTSSGTLILANDNTYTGTTVIGSSTPGGIQVGNGGSTGSLGSGAVTINGSASLSFNRTGTLTMANAISGTGTFVQNGPGTLALTGTSTYTGATAVNAGALRVNGALGNTAVTVASGASLGGTGTIANTGANIVAIGAGATLVGASGSTFTTGAMTLANTTAINVALGSTAAPTLFQVNGNLTLDGVFNITDAGGLGTGLYRVFTYTGALTDNGATVGSTPAGTTAGQFVVQTSTAGQVNLVSSVVAQINFWDGSNTTANGSVDGGTGTWSVTGTNWTNTAGAVNAAMSPQPGFAFFSAGSGTVTVDNTAGAVAVTGIQFASTNPAGYTITGGDITLSGAIAELHVGDGTAAGAAFTGVIASRLIGTSAVNKTDLGTLVISGDNTYSGGTTISAGTLQVGSGGASGTLGSGAVVNNAALVFNRSDTSTVTNAISGTGTLTQSGSGVTILAANNTYAGVTTIASGTLQIGAGGTTGTLGSGAVVNNTALVFNRSDTYAVTNAISGAGTLTQAGTGTTVLSAANTYTGATTVASGTLQVGNGGTSGSLGTGSVANSGSLVFNRTDAVTVANTITGSGALVKNNTNILTLTGTNSYTGATTVNSGGLRVNGALGATAVTVASGASLGGSGSIAGPVAIGGGATLVGASGSTLTTGALSLADTSNINIALGSSAAPALFEVNGNLTLDGHLHITDAGGFGQGLYRVFHYTGSLTDNGASVDSAPAGANLAQIALQTSTAGEVNLVYGATGDLNFWDGDAGPASDGSIQGGVGTWSTAGNNWTNAAGSANGAMSPQPGNAIFANGSGTVTVSNTGGPVTVTGIQFATTNPAGYKLTGGDIALSGATANLRVGDGTAAGAAYHAEIASRLTGASAVNKSDLGTLVLSGNNTYAGGTTITDGTLQIGAGGTTGTLGSGAVINNAALVFNRSDAVTVANAISGSGTLTQSGSGTTVLSANNTYSGDTTIASGTLQIGSGGTTGSLGSGAVINNAALVFNRSDAVTLANLVSGTGSLTKSGAGTLTLTTANTYTGLTTLAAGTLALNLGAAGQIINSGNNLRLAGGTLDFLGVTTTNAQSFGAVQITAGANLLTKSTFTGSVSSGGGVDLGALTVTGGSLDIAGLAVDSTPSKNADSWVKASGLATSLPYISASITTNSGADLVGVNSLGNLVIADSLAYAKGATAFSNSASALVKFISTGGLGAGSNGQAGAGVITLDPATQVVGAGNGHAYWAGIINAYTSGVTTLNLGANTLHLDINAVLVSSAGSDLLITGGTLTAGGLTSGNAGTITVGNANAVTLATTVVNNGAGVVGLTLNGPGVTTLSGANTYTGVTTLGGGVVVLGAVNNAGVSGPLGASGSILLNGGTLRYSADNYDYSSRFSTGSNQAYKVDTNGRDVTWAANLSSTGGALAKSGAGTLTLTGANTYSGATTVNGGTLAVNGSLTASPVTVNNGATLTGSGNITGAVSVANGGRLAGAQGSTLSTGALTLATTAHTDAALSALPSAALFSVTGDLTLDGDLTVAASGAFGAGVYRLFNYTGTLTDNTLDLAALTGSPTSGATAADVYVQTVRPGQVNLINTVGIIRNAWDGAGEANHNDGLTQGGDGVWSVANRNWTDNGALNGTFSANPGLAVFGNTAGTVTIDNTPGQVTASGLRFDTTGYTITGGALTLAGTTADLNTGSGVTATIASGLQGAAAVNKTGAGTLVLTGASTYTGATTITAGTLLVNGSTTSATTVSGGASLGGFGTIAASVVVSDAAHLLGAEGQTLTTNSLSLSGGTLVDVTLGSAGSAALFHANGGLTLDGTLNISSPAALGVGVYRLFDYTGSLADNSLDIGSVPAGTDSSSLSIRTSTSGQVDLVNLAGAVLRNWDGDAASHFSNGLVDGGSGTWTLTGNNWTTDDGFANAAMYPVPSVAYFAGAPGTVTVDNSDGAVTVLGMIFETGGYTVTGDAITLQSLVSGTALIQTNADTTVAAELTGSATLEKSGAGMLTLTAANTYTGGTIVSFGTLRVGNGGTTGALGAGDVFLGSGGTLAYDRSDDVTFDKVVTGSGSFAKLGTGRLTLTGNNAYTGTTTVSNGILQVGAGGTTGSIGTGAVVNNAAIVFNRSDSVTLANAISGTGSLRQSGAGTLVLTGANTYSGATRIDAGTTLQVGDGGTSGSLGTGDTLLEGTLSFNRSDELLYTGSISGSGLLEQDGSGLTIITGTIANTGGIIINAGELRVGNGGTSGSIGAGGVTLGAGGTLSFDRSDDVVLSAAMTGAGSFVKLGAGRLTLTANNDYTGMTTVSNGILQIGDGGTTGTLGSGGVTLGAGGTLAYDRSDDITLSTAMTGAGSFAQLGAGTLTLTGDNTYTGTTTISAGTLQVGSGGTTGSIGTGAVVNNAALVFNRSDTVTVSGAISGTGALRQSGSGTLVLTGANTYSGTTFIDAGTTLQVGDGGASGSLGTGDTQLEGTLSFNRSGELLYAGSISGSGVLVQDGSGLTILTGTIANTGGLIINAGELRIGNGGTSGSLGSGAVTVNTHLEFDRTDSTTVANDISGTGGISQMGDGTLTLSGDNTFTGDSFVYAGKLSLAANSSVANLTVFDGGTLGGAGTVRGDLINFGTLSPGFSPGTLNVAGNFTQEATGVFRVELASLTVFDKLIVGGTATLDGKILIVNSGYTPVTDDTFVILTAGGGVTGEFAALDSELYFAQGFRVLYNPNDVTLLVTAMDLVPAAMTANQANVAAAANVGLNSGAMPVLRNAVANAASSQQIAQYLSALSPQSYDRWWDNLRQNDIALIRTTEEHLDRIGGLRPNGEFIRVQAVQRESRFDGDSDIAAGSASATGVSLGADGSLGDDLSVGALFSYTNERVNNGSSRTTINHYTPAVYARYTMPCELLDSEIFVEGVAGWGFADYSAKRGVDIPGMSTASGKTEAQDRFVSTRIGATHRVGEMRFSPYAGIQHTRWEADGFDESGAGEASLRVNEQKAESLASRLGFAADMPMKVSGLIVTPRLDIAWRHEFQQSRRDIGASLAGQSFNVRSQSPATDGMEATVGLSVRVTEIMTVYGSVGAFVDGSNGHSQNYNVGVNFSF